MSEHRRRSMRWHKGKCNKKECQVNTSSFPRKKALTWQTYIQKAWIACLGIRNSSEVLGIPLRVSLSFNWWLSDGLLVFVILTNHYLYYSIIISLSIQKSEIQQFYYSFFVIEEVNRSDRTHCLVPCWLLFLCHFTVSERKSIIFCCIRLIFKQFARL